MSIKGQAADYIPQKNYRQSYALNSKPSVAEIPSLRFKICQISLLVLPNETVGKVSLAVAKSCPSK